MTRVAVIVGVVGLLTDVTGAWAQGKANPQRVEQCKQIANNSTRSSSYCNRQPDVCRTNWRQSYSTCMKQG